MTSRHVWLVLVNVLAAAVAVAVLWSLRTIVSWVLVALFLTLALEPVVSFLTRRKLKRGIAVGVVFLGLVGLISTLVVTLVPMFVAQGKALVARGPELIAALESTAPVQWADEHFGVLEQAEGAVRDGFSTAAVPAFAAAKSVLHGLAGTVTILALTVFMLVFGPELVNQGLEWLPPERRPHARTLTDRMRKGVGGYVSGTMLVACIGGVVMATALAIIGVPYFVPLGLVMAVLGIIPFLGPALGAVLLVGTAFASGGLKAGLITAAVFFVYQQVENHLLHPLVQRKTLKMNPLLITLALLAGASLAGVLGTLLALPVAGAIQVLLEDALETRRARFAAEPAVEPATQNRTALPTYVATSRADASGRRSVGATAGR
ncbi:MAG: AI-2E family transporter [Myxococcaceae bacterium]|nr:AI-2E family transporter [Myxococcaceae bacterium]